VAGFTFIKSFGLSHEVYLGWLSYYVLTLPVFVAHTYLVAYVLIPNFLSRRYFPLFVLLFLLLIYGFSVVELILSNEYIYKWFPTSSEVSGDYLAPGNVITSGLGNFYIVLVFLAARTVRNWYHADNRRKELLQIELQQQMENAITKIQPLMLLYAIDHIDKMVEQSSPEISKAIALTSELLNDVMTYHEEKQQLFSKEINLVKKQVSLISLLRKNKPDVEFFISGDPGHIELPPMILFTLIDLIFRRFEHEQYNPELIIEASGYSNMITVQVIHSGVRREDEAMEKCLSTIQQLESFYKGKVSISFETHHLGSSVILRKL